MRTRPKTTRPTSRANVPPTNGQRRQQLLALWRRFADHPVASEAIYTTLREAILSGVLEPGEHLGELPLAALFKRSRTPVREAVLRLESERLAERAARRGFVVRRITREEILEVYAVRGALAALAARLAALGILPTELEHVRWIDERIREAGDRRDYAAMRDLNIDFHEAVCRASRNSMLVQFMSQIHDWVRRFPETTFSHPGRAATALAEHRALVDALERRDAEAAERIARTNMEHAMQIRVAMLQASPRPRGSSSRGSS